MTILQLDKYGNEALHIVVGLADQLLAMLEMHYKCTHDLSSNRVNGHANYMYIHWNTHVNII